MKLTTQKVCDWARKFEGVTEKDHFGSDAFCANGRIFATVWHNENKVTLMLNEEQQKAILLEDGSEGFVQMQNSWGRDAIRVELDFVDVHLFKKALKLAWINSANKRSSPTKKAGLKKKTKKVV